MTDPGLIAAFLLGATSGAVGVLIATGVIAFFVDVRDVVRGAPLNGEGMERNRRRDR